MATDEKRVGLTLSGKEYRVLKLYSARYDMTMSEVIKEFTMRGVQQHSQVCVGSELILQSEKMEEDPRLRKDCWGVLCLCCKQREGCAKGEHEGVWVYNEERFGPWEEVGKIDRPTF